MAARGAAEERTVNSESIRTFLMLSKLKNFTRTAERLYVAQSTVTNRIAELEAETGKNCSCAGRAAWS